MVNFKQTLFKVQLQGIRVHNMVWPGGKENKVLDKLDLSKKNNTITAYNSIHIIIFLLIPLLLPTPPLVLVSVVLMHSEPILLDYDKD